MAKFDLAWFERLHREMFGDVWKWAGKPREKELSFGVKFYQIEPQLLQLERDIACWGPGGMPLDEQAALLHHRAVYIHPFPNGNGRWARMLANIWLRLHSHPITAWPEGTIGTIGQVGVIRNEYLEAIHAADRGDYSSLLGLHLRYREVGE